MLDRIIRFSIKNKLVVLLCTLGLIAWGSYALSQLPIDAIPDITDNQVQIITNSPALAPEEVEKMITYPVEASMATIPGLKHSRSISRFGLSVVTLTFEENKDIYWARQQVQERLNEAIEQIPKGIGTPKMMPVTTGLGEIYQYVIHVEKPYQGEYNLMKLRTIQDWMVRRQLIGTPGVADVSSFGGYLKQFEVSINPEKLFAVNLTIADIFKALRDNNQNAGGAYIEHQDNSYFIRTNGLIDSLNEIGNIVVSLTPSGIPIRICDVAQVRFGHAVRYGAMTYNNDGEAVGGIVLMLKGANSNKVIRQVKKRIQQIQKTLPDGVYIEPFLDRSKLVNKTIHTVSKNLIEGALIVILVLIFFLGSLRSGLLVASVIPLSMLFAFGMMYIFGVSGNLMSLGALDFGLIVDGAVIIVESVTHSIQHRQQKNHSPVLSKVEMDLQVQKSAGKMMHSATFGQIVILIVYLPILALVGIEGKMFRPMAQTVSFAIIGALILSLTYIPAMSALVLPRRLTQSSHNISNRIMVRLSKYYGYLLSFSLNHKWRLISITAILLGLAGFTFSRLGSEFVPQLDEGDFAVEMRMLPGTSLSEMIATSNKAADILLKKFPEVKEVIGKIGSSEIPTDPMPIEACDLMVLLKDKKDWVSAYDRESLADSMSQALSVLAGVQFSFQQPIQMRFNELMTGSKQDVVIKIFGDQTDTLSHLANVIGAMATNTSGATDIYIEQITGLPQIVVDYDRRQIAKYGLNIRDINNIIETAFAGKTAGIAFEGDRRFDVTLRLNKDYRHSVSDVKALFIPTPSGLQIPLSQVADVHMADGPNQIQKENARKRITVGFNTRNRDVESIITEIQENINQKLHLPPGYSIQYGGTFKNLIHAKKRLALVVPVALMLIFILLFFAFHSVKKGLLIFTAIPLATIGGVFALWLRDMPFSISAAVGFIALFGVAVLNGIVLINEFAALKKAGVTDLKQRVIQGAQTRLRPVLMTATVASLGFLPMALSQTSGAEVQRPLATVVIGGLVTSTLLTLVILPILYILFEKIPQHRKPTKINSPKLLGAVLLFVGCSLIKTTAKAQPMKVTDTAVTLTLEQALKLGTENNLSLKAANLELQRYKVLAKEGPNLPKTLLGTSYGHINEPTVLDNEYRISQDFEFPTVYIRQSQWRQQQSVYRKLKQEDVANHIIFKIKTEWYQMALLLQKARLLKKQEALFSNFLHAAELRYQTGETNRLELANARSQVMQLQNKIRINQAALETQRALLQALLNLDYAPRIKSDSLLPRPFLHDLSGPTSWQENSKLQLSRQNIVLANTEKKWEQSKLLPDLNLAVSSQTFRAISNQRFTVFSLGVAIPLWPRAQIQRIKAAKIKQQKVVIENKAMTQNTRLSYISAIQSVQKQLVSLHYFQQEGLPQAHLIVKNAQTAFKNGEIGYVEYVENLRQAFLIQNDYLKTLKSYNQAVINLEFITGHP